MDQPDIRNESPQGVESITPYGDSRHKTAQVQEMFDSIAPAYDFMNRAMTMGIDRMWRSKVVNRLKDARVSRILDVATGTGDLAIKIARDLPAAVVTGIDLSEGMLEVGRKKVAETGFDSRIKFQQADCLELPFADGEFDAITVAFGVRNFERLLDGYREMYRVLSPGGLLCVLELSTPTGKLTRPMYNFYTRHIIPLAGRLISKDVRAYSYLPESIAAVAQGERMCELMRVAGFGDVHAHAMTFGTCTLYTARK